MSFITRCFLHFWTNFCSFSQVEGAIKTCINPVHNSQCPKIQSNFHVSVDSKAKNKRSTQPQSHH